MNWTRTRTILSTGISTIFNPHYPFLLFSHDNFLSFRISSHLCIFEFQSYFRNSVVRRSRYILIHAILKRSFSAHLVEKFKTSISSRYDPRRVKDPFEYRWTFHRMKFKHNSTWLANFRSHTFDSHARGKIFLAFTPRGASMHIPSYIVCIHRASTCIAQWLKILVSWSSSSSTFLEAHIDANWNERETDFRWSTGVAR